MIKGKKGMGLLTDDDEILTLEEASILFKVSAKTFLKMLREEDLPARKIGREWRFSCKALLKWMEEGHSQQYANAENQVKDYFNNVAPQYNEQRSSVYGNALREIIFNNVEFRKDGIIADIGAGTGYLTIELAKKGRRVIAVDNSAQMLSVANNEASRAGIDNIEFLEGNAEDLPVKSNLVDYAFANMLLHHVNDPLQVLKEMNRILKPGGMIVVTDIEEHGHMWLRQEKSDLWMGFNKEELAEWLKESGFKNISIKDTGCDCCTGAGDGSKTVKIKTFLALGKK